MTWVMRPVLSAMRILVDWNMSRARLSPAFVPEVISCRRKIQPALDAIKTLLDSINPSRLARNLSLKVADLGHHMSHRRFKRCYARFELRHIRLDLIDRASNMPKMLKNKVARIVSHRISLIQFAGNSQLSRHSASAPEMISINSFVIIAWRVRL